jgi:hypothetical protein
LIAMATDYAAAIAGVTALVILLTAMTAFVLSRPSDLAPTPPDDQRPCPWSVRCLDRPSALLQPDLDPSIAFFP